MSNFTKDQAKQVLANVKDLRSLDNWPAFYDAIKSAQSLADQSGDNKPRTNVYLERLRTFFMRMEDLERG